MPINAHQSRRSSSCEVQTVHEGSKPTGYLDAKFSEGAGKGSMVGGLLHACMVSFSGRWRELTFSMHACIFITSACTCKYESLAVHIK